MRNDHRPNPIIIAGAVAFIAFVTAIGLAGQFDAANDRDSAVTGSGSVTRGDGFTSVPEGAVYAELGSIEPVVLADASEVVTLVESPDPGLLEVGVRITRSGAPVEVNPGEFTLVTDDGRVYAPSELIGDSGSVVFTINADPHGRRYKLVWQRSLSTKLVMFDKLDDNPVLA